MMGRGGVWDGRMVGGWGMMWSIAIRGGGAIWSWRSSIRWRGWSVSVLGGRTRAISWGWAVSINGCLK